jgi:hypothetical protein
MMREKDQHNSPARLAQNLGCPELLSGGACDIHCRSFAGGDDLALIREVL